MAVEFQIQINFPSKPDAKSGVRLNLMFRNPIKTIAAVKILSTTQASNEQSSSLDVRDTLKTNYRQGV